jgi:hypothetical protein
MFAYMPRKEEINVMNQNIEQYFTAPRFLLIMPVTKTKIQTVAYENVIITLLIDAELPSWNSIKFNNKQAIKVIIDNIINTTDNVLLFPIS